MTAIMSIQTSHIHAEQAGNTVVYPDSTSSYHDGDIEESIVESIKESIGAETRLLPGRAGAADGNQQGQDMTVVRVVRTQPNRLKRLAASCAACEPGISMIMTAIIINLSGRPLLKDTDDVRQSDIALRPYQIEEVRGLQRVQLRELGRAGSGWPGQTGQ